MSDVPPLPITQYLLAREDMRRYFHRHEADARALVQIMAEEEPGTLIYLYEVRLIHTIKVLPL